ncbi:hypothetical protein K378_04650 [Streptomyces sp. Amel2xB2]|uniref:DUF5947 family protein n=1 Tax=Streptomyces sp. Amel2xB2 TaxID=1305829 RepID=UPI000DBF4962|nr:DUF5947 family protein [Streptomyces sp. Amel2xB2]RAJ59953.1 hypothetical protein K378_04650 [Streptomyces sp. Amel2xB2]
MNSGAAADGRARGGRLRELLRRPYAPAATGTGSGTGTRRGAADPASEHCDLCAEPVPEGHRHMLDAEQSAVLCTCGPCTLLFGQSAAGGRHYRLLPERRLRLAGPRIDAALRARLGVPVGLAFFVRDGASGEVSVGYPSPLGVTRAAVAPEVWNEVVAGYPEAARIADDVEALLVHSTDGMSGPGGAGGSDGADEHWIVPLDDCYRLAAVVRTHWRGLSGGPEVRGHIDAFFAGLAEAEAAASPTG